MSQEAAEEPLQLPARHASQCTGSAGSGAEIPLDDYRRMYRICSVMQR